MNLLMEYEYLTYALVAIGALVLLACTAFLLFLLYHIVRGFFIACSFMCWSFKVMKVNGRKPIWKKFFPTLMSAWWRHIGHDGSVKVYSGASVFLGWGNYSVVKQGKFVDTAELGPNALEDDDDEDDDEFELPDSAFEPEPDDLDYRDFDRRQSSRNVNLMPTKKRWPRSKKK